MHPNSHYNYLSAAQRGNFCHKIVSILDADIFSDRYTGGMFPSDLQNHSAQQKDHMESFTKAVFSKEMIETLARKQFGNSVSVQNIEELTAGWFNTVYWIRYATALPDMVIRIAPHPQQPVLSYEKNLMSRELEILHMLQAYPNIPMPKLLGYDTSRSLLEHDYMFLEKFNGVMLQDVKDNLSPQNLQEIEYEVGHMVKRMANIEGPHFGYITGGLGAGSATWREAFTQIIEALIQDGEALEVEAPLPWDELRALLAPLMYVMDEITRPGFLHWDLWAGNIFVKPINGRYVVEGFIDWERGLWGDPDMEQAVCCRNFGPAFYEGYGKKLAEQGPEAVRLSLYRLYLWLIMLIEVKVRFEDPMHLPWVRERLAEELAYLQSPRNFA